MSLKMPSLLFNGLTNSCLGIYKFDGTTHGDYLGMFLLSLSHEPSVFPTHISGNVWLAVGSAVGARLGSLVRRPTSIAPPYPIMVLRRTRMR